MAAALIVLSDTPKIRAPGFLVTSVENVRMCGCQNILWMHASVTAESSVNYTVRREKFIFFINLPIF